MSLNQLLRKYPQEERKRLLKLGLISSNSVFINYLIKSREKLTLNEEELFKVCRQGTDKSFQYLKAKVDFNTMRHSITGDSCAHTAGEYGNLPALKYLKRQGFDFGTLNHKHQTALAHSLKNNQRGFEPVIGFLGKQTPLGITDGDSNLSFQVHIPMDQSRARLLQWLKERESGN